MCNGYIYCFRSFQILYFYFIKISFIHWNKLNALFCLAYFNYPSPLNRHFELFYVRLLQAHRFFVINFNLLQYPVKIYCILKKVNSEQTMFYWSCRFRYRDSEPRNQDAMPWATDESHPRSS